jgi:hypothetical protein
MSGLVRARPGKFAAFATTPCSTPPPGADQLKRAVTQPGLRGTMLFGHAADRYLDEPDVDPFLDRAEALVPRSTCTQPTLPSSRQASTAGQSWWAGLKTAASRCLVLVEGRCPAGEGVQRSGTRVPSSALRAEIRRPESAVGSILACRALPDLGFSLARPGIRALTGGAGPDRRQGWGCWRRGGRGRLGAAASANSQGRGRG